MKGILIQYGCSFLLSLVAAMNSFICAWPSYAIKVLESEQSPLGFQISQNAANLIGSIPMLGSFISTLMAGYITDAIGRKKTHLLCGLFFAVAWSLIVTARSTFQILFARFIMGLSMGTSCVIVVIYNSEITELIIRGSTSAISGLLYNVGIMLSYLAGWFCSYDVVCYISLTFTVIYVILMCFLKESPTYLLKVGKEKEALKSLKFYRGESETTQAILEELSYMKSQGNYKDTVKPSLEQDSINELLEDYVEPAMLSEKEKLQLNEKENSKANVEKKNAWILLFTVPHNRRAIISSITFMLLVNSMGMIAVQTYASQFFTKAVPTLSPDLCSVIFSLILVLSNCLSVATIDLLPRRTLMFLTCLASTFCLATMGAAMRWPAIPTWVIIGAVIVYVLVFHLGVINIVFVQLSESFGPQVMSAAAVLVFSSMFLSSFVVLYLYVPAIKYIGIDGTFFVFAAISAFSTVLSHFWTKETRRVPVERIQKMFDIGIAYRKDNDTES